MYIQGTENSFHVLYIWLVNLLEVITWDLENLGLLKFFPLSLFFSCFLYSFIFSFLGYP